MIGDKRMRGRNLQVNAVSGIKTIAVTDYTKLENTPIKVLRGETESNFILLSGLTAGHYTIHGYFKYDAVGDIYEIVGTPLELLVLEEVEKGTQESIKVMEYMFLEDGKTYLQKFTYRGALLENVDKISLEGPEWVDLIEPIPTEPIEDEG